MMKKIALTFAFSTVIAGAVLWSTDQTAPQDGSIGDHPGWFDQYTQLKGLEGGIIPADLKLQWYKHDQKNAVLNKKSSGNLENVLEVGPSNIGGRSRSIIIDPRNSDRLITGGVSGGLFLSEDAGQSWNASDDQAATLSVTCIARSPFNPNMVYFGSGETYNNTLNPNGLGVFRSDDAGNTITHLESSTGTPMSQIWDIQHSLVHDSTIYVGTHNGGLWRSQNAGETFERIYGTAGAIHEIRVFDDSTIMFGVSASGIFRMNENTLSSVKLDNGFATSNFTRIAFDYCKAYPDVIYAHVLTSGYNSLKGSYKSSDGGKSWQNTALPTQVRYNQAWYYFALAVSPTDSNLVLTAGLDAAYTRNGGNNWFYLNYSHSDYHHFEFYNDGKAFLAANDGGIYRYQTATMGSAREDLNNGFNVTQFYAGHFHPTNNGIVAGAQDNWTTITRTGSSNFYNEFSSGDGAFCAFHQQDPDQIYWSSQYLNLRRYDDELKVNYNIGKAVRDSIRDQSGAYQNYVWFINPVEINLLDGDQIYVPTLKEVYRSNNQGTSWQSLTTNLPGNTYSIGLSYEMDPIAYIGGTGSFLHRVDNASSSRLNEVWLSNKAPIEFKGSTIGNIEVDPNDPGTIYCAMTNISSRGRIWKVTDADTDNPVWQDLHANLPTSLPVSWIEVDPDNPDFLIIATDYGLYTSTNGGGWWEKETRIPNVAIDQIRLRHSDRKLYIFTHGRGAWTAELAENPTSSVSVAPEVKVAVFPNPAADWLHIEVESLQSVNLYNRAGQVVLSSKTSHILVSGLAEGVYFAEVFTAQGKAVKKIMISRNQ